MSKEVDFLTLLIALTTLYPILKKKKSLLSYHAEKMSSGNSNDIFQSILASAN